MVSALRYQVAIRDAAGRGLFAELRGLNVAESLSFFDQSRHFENFFPEENAAFRILVLTPKGKDKEESLTIMRQAMLGAFYDAAFFIGGMKGGEDEFFQLQRRPNSSLCFPVATTGGAALRLLRDLQIRYDYFLLVHQLPHSLDEAAPLVHNA
jgi:hypothetical protein